MWAVENEIIFLVTSQIGKYKYMSIKSTPTLVKTVFHKMGSQFPIRTYNECYLCGIADYNNNMSAHCRYYQVCWNCVEVLMAFVQTPSYELSPDNVNKLSLVPIGAWCHYFFPGPIW